MTVILFSLANINVLKFEHGPIYNSGFESMKQTTRLTNAAQTDYGYGIIYIILVRGHDHQGLK